MKLAKEQLSYECLVVIGIDEHAIHKGYKFASTIADLTIEGKSRNLVESKLMGYKGRDKVKVIYMDLCESLNRKHQTARGCMRNIRGLKGITKQMKCDAPQEFSDLAETISDWFTPIIRMWRFTKNNGITEGFHRKMKLIQRRAYGYRNFEFKRSTNEILP